MRALTALTLMLVSASAVAQMPIVLLDVPPAKSATSVSAQLESTLLCKPGTSFTTAGVEKQFVALGMTKRADGYLYPKGAPTLFGDRVVRALVTAGDGERKATVFLVGRSGGQQAKRFGVTRVNETANTDDPSHYRVTSKKTTLYVDSADELQIGNTERYERFDSAITCQLKTGS